jgi:hypothetical protein
VAWDEWEQIKAAVAGGPSLQTRLNQSPADSGGGTPTSGSTTGTGGGSGALRHSNRPWSRAAGTADALRISTQSTKNGLESSHTGVPNGAVGLASVSALETVLTSWERRLESVRDECESLEPKLRAVARDLGEVDRAVAVGARAVHVSEGDGNR